MLGYRYTTLTVTLALLWIGAAPAPAAGGWIESHPQALAESKKTGKPILVNFTGSDWCGWCIKLDREVFSANEFRKWAKAEVVLLTIDFPRRKLSRSLQQQNEQLKVRYGIRGFPTILFLDSDGNVLGRSGYREGGARKWIEHAQSITAKMPRPRPRATRTINAKVPRPRPRSQPRPGTVPGESLPDDPLPEVLRLESNFAMAVIRARSMGLGLLLLIDSGLDTDNELAIRSLLLDRAFIELANHRLAVVRVKRQGRQSPGKNRLRAMDKFLREAGVDPRSVHMALLDPGEDEPEVLYQNDAFPPPAAVLPLIRAGLAGLRLEGRWLEDFALARSLAEKRKRPMLLEFGGSDWCPRCKKMRENTFSDDLFKDFAREQFVLVRIDFPRSKSQDVQTRMQNIKLKQKYGIRGYPTYVVLSHGGGLVSKLVGYQKGGADAFVRKLAPFTREQTAMGE